MSENNEAASVEPSESTGLLDGVEAQDSSQSDSQEAQLKTEVDHRASDSIPDDEAIERPDYFPENFWDKDKGEPDVEALAKSWKDLRKQISQGKHKAPPEGKYDLSSFGEGADQLPLVPVYKEWAAKHGLSQAAFDEFADNVVKMANEVVGNQPEIDAAAERKALGPNADAKINGMVNWARGLVNKGIWSAEDFDEFKVMGGTAKGISALMKIREAYEGRIPTESAPIEGMPTDTELQAMVGDPKYQTDPAYRQKVERMFNARYNS
jgi:hypothetical protein